MSLHYTAWYSTPPPPPPSYSLSSGLSPLALLFSSDYSLTTGSDVSHHLITFSVHDSASSPFPVAGMRLTGILIFKNLINGF